MHFTLAKIEISSGEEIGQVQADEMTLEIFVVPGKGHEELLQMLMLERLELGLDEILRSVPEVDDEHAVRPLLSDRLRMLPQSGLDLILVADSSQLRWYSDLRASRRFDAIARGESPIVSLSDAIEQIKSRTAV